MIFFLRDAKIKLLLFCLIVLFTACKKAEENVEVVQPPPPVEVQLTYNIEPTTKGKLKIAGETNLPDDTDLNIRVKGKSGNYDQSFAVKVQAGQFAADEFSAAKKPLPPGEYIALVAMPLSTLQPPNVRAIIGRNGEHITGDIVRRYENSAAVIEVRKKFHLQPDGSIILVIAPQTGQQ